MGNEVQACTGSGATASRRKHGGAGDDDGGPLRLLWRAEEAKEEAERMRRAAGRPPLQAGQCATQSGQARRVAATQRPSSDLDRP